MPQRTLKTVLAVCFTPFVILCLTPCILPIRWPRLVWTYLLPVIPFVVCFDGWMSCLRAYSPQELSEIVRSLPGGTYQWEIGEERGGFLPVTYLIGYPTCGSRSSTSINPKMPMVVRTALVRRVSLSSFIPAADPLQKTLSIQHDKRLGPATARQAELRISASADLNGRVASATLWVTDQGNKQSIYRLQR
jgi:hypothetical protein